MITVLNVLLFICDHGVRRVTGHALNVRRVTSRDLSVRRVTVHIAHNVRRVTVHDHTARRLTVHDYYVRHRKDRHSVAVHDRGVRLVNVISVLDF